MKEINEACEVLGLIFNKDHCSLPRKPFFSPPSALLKQLGYFLPQFVLALSEYCSRAIRLVKYSSVGAFALSRMSSFHAEAPGPNFIPGMDCFGCMCTQMQKVFLGCFNELPGAEQEQMLSQAFSNGVCFPLVPMHVTIITVERNGCVYC